MARFANLSETDIQDLICGKDSQNTKKLCLTLFNILVSYAKEKKKNVDFELISKKEMDDLLKTFYVEVRKADGSKYKINSYRAIRSAIQRKMKEIRGNDFDIIKDKEFSISNLHYQAESVSLKKEGLGDTTHHKPICKEDMDILYSSSVFSLENPVGLQNKVFFELMLHFCRRGRENLRALKVSDFLIKNNSGTEMVIKATDELTKNHRDQDRAEEQMVMVATGGKNCPVTSFKLYVSKLNPNLTALFQRPKRNFQFLMNPWYDNMVLGEKKLNSMMKTISMEAKLSEVYTNHCIRATAITILDQNGVEARHIMTVSGHRSENSIRSYCKTSDTRKREMSDVLASNTSGLNEEKSLKMCSSNNQNKTLECNPIFNLGINLENNHELPSSSSSRLNLPAGFSFSNCQVTFNM